MFTFRHRSILMVILFIIAMVTSGFNVVAQSSANYNLEMDVLDAAGALSHSTTYVLEDAAGQPSAIGKSISNNYELYAGYLTPVTSMPTSIEAMPDAQQSLTLGQNYPNPFNVETTITYTLKNETHVILRIFDMMGKEVRTLVNEKQGPGFYSIVWRARDHNQQRVNNGIYFYTIKTDKLTLVKKMSLIN